MSLSWKQIAKVYHQLIGDITEQSLHYVEEATKREMVFRGAIEGVIGSTDDEELKEALLETVEHADEVGTKLQNVLDCAFTYKAVSVRPHNPLVKLMGEDIHVQKARKNLFDAIDAL
jgi:hypothetical protein